MSATTTTTIRLEDIVVDASLQSRATMNDEAIEDYAEKYRNGVDMPPVIIFHDGDRNWLAGGFHRAIAADKAGLTEIDADIRQGSKDDALLYAVASNHDNGVQRTIADKRRAVEMVLAHEKFRKKPVNQIAKMCRVSRTLVETVISSILPESKIPTVKEVTRNGTTYEMQTANIGKPKDEPKPTAEESRPADDGDDTEDAGVELPDIGEVKLVPTGFAKNYVNDEDEGDEETHESFSDINRLGDFYDSLFSRLKPILADRNNGELLTIQGHLEIALEQVNDLIEQLEAEKDK